MSVNCGAAILADIRGENGGGGSLADNMPAHVMVQQDGAYFGSQLVLLARQALPLGVARVLKVLATHLFACLFLVEPVTTKLLALLVTHVGKLVPRAVVPRQATFLTEMAVAGDVTACESSHKHRQASVQASGQAGVSVLKNRSVQAARSPG